ncbi:MAG: hypothetical protein ACJ780_30270 [Solirubrobacteraceae bacterium]
MATTRAITDEAELRKIVGEPAEVVVSKISDRLNHLTRQFIERSPFVCEAYTQCPKALIRSELWNPERHVDRSELPRTGEILRLLNDPSFDVDGYERERSARYARREGLY